MEITSFSLSLLLFLLLAASASARPGLPFHPCKTLLISTYSVSFQPRDNPDPHHRPELLAVVADVREFRPQPLLHDTRFRADEDQTLVRRPGLALGSSGSLRDRTLDVLSVLASLLFGAACGALTAGTMFLIWCLFHSRFQAYRSLDDFSDVDDDDDADDDDIFNPKKVHNNKGESNVAVPAAPPSVDTTETALLKKESA